jgi:hypothetical protein
VAALVDAATEGQIPCKGLKRETIQMPSAVCNGAMGIERIEGPSQRPIIEVLGYDAGRKEPRGWFILEKCGTR